MKTIPLYRAVKRGSRRLYVADYAQVDDADFPYLNRFRWFLKKGRHDRTGYASRHIRVNGKSYDVFMHREIMGLDLNCRDPRKVDHIDRSGTNNQRSNLRLSTTSQNNANQSIRKDNIHGYRGITTNTHNPSKWEASIDWQKKQYYLGIFNDKHTAALVYNYASQILHGSFAALNNIPNEHLPSAEIQSQLKSKVEQKIRGREAA